MSIMFECIVENKHTILTNFRCIEANELNLKKRYRLCEYSR